MTKDEWVDVCGHALEAAGIQNFHPLEIADVGRESVTALHGSQILTAPPPYRIVNAIANAILLCNVLRDLRSAVRPTPVLVNSWYRDSAYNHRIGGVPNSMHLTCGAADVTKAGFTPDEVADILERHPDSDEFGIGRYKTFTHIDVRGMIGRTAPARW
jgi:hypothetical protein|tara:strand:+ start:499 stop:972 length:474 start_codon:yes stop_codon:yes gene_type:complete